MDVIPLTLRAGGMHMKAHYGSTCLSDCALSLPRPAAASSNSRASRCNAAVASTACARLPRT